jgi:hypothetical protein
MARAGVDDPWEGAGSQLGYQRTPPTGSNRDVDAYRDEVVHDLEAGDPQRHGSQKARRSRRDVHRTPGLERLAAAAPISGAIDTFGRTEALRMNQGRRAACSDAAELLPFTPAYAGGALARAGRRRHEQHARAPSRTRLRAKRGSDATASSAFGKVAAAPTFTPGDDARVSDRRAPRWRNARACRMSRLRTPRRTAGRSVAHLPGGSARRVRAAARPRRSERPRVHR